MDYEHQEFPKWKYRADGTSKQFDSEVDFKAEDDGLWADNPVAFTTDEAKAAVKADAAPKPAKKSKPKK